MATPPQLLMAYRGVGIRFVAVLIDSVILGIVFGILSAVSGGVDMAGGGATAKLNGGPALLFYVLAFAYYVVLEKSWGATLGKKAVGIRVVQEDGSPITWGQSVLRNLLRIIDGLFVYLVGAIFVWTSDTKQRLGDRVAKTYVVKPAALQSGFSGQAPPYSAPADAVPPPLSPPPPLAPPAQAGPPPPDAEATGAAPEAPAAPAAPAPPGA
jgi:uncharacterized RDD family membrane protein YckC